jgi:ParB family chromosome partitioning protein
MNEIPAIVRQYDDQKNSEISLIENIQREDLNLIEKAIAMKEILTKYNLTQQNLADAIGKNRSTITNTLRILNLDSRVIEFAREGKLTE